MKPSHLAIASISFLASAAVFADTQGKVHPDPAGACKDSKPHELCFDRPQDGVARSEYLSQPFYAVILKTAAPCSIKEEERLAVQALFPGTKVFSMRFNCDDDVEENIRYTNVNDKFGFLAVYAGATLQEANKRLAQVKALGRFQGANVRKMRAKLVYP